MKKSILLFAVIMLTVAAVIFTGVGYNTATNAATETIENFDREIPPRKTLRAFGSEAELKEYFRELMKNHRRDGNVRKKSSEGATTDSAAPLAMESNASESKADSDKSGESVTNVQHAGVDEGGIVKLHGEHLVILRRGRLFTVKIGDNSLKPVSSSDAFAPGINPKNDWYDEMLVSGDTVVVIGYSYERGGTEINLFDISRAGALNYRSTYHLRSNDYYSSRNYASRLIGEKLVFYTPQYLYINSDDVMRQFPALRRWRKGVTENEFKSIVAPTKVFRSTQPVNTNNNLALHTVTICDLASRDFSCQGTGILGAPGRVFYVSPTSVYVWTSDWNYRNAETKQRSMLYQMPLDGGAPTALGVAGSPVDQFSFLESADNHLNVLVRSDNSGDGMWSAEVAAGDVALFRTPLDNFSDGSDIAARSNYRALPKPEGYTFQNRFVGDYLLYGTGSGWGRPEQKDAGNLYAVNWKDGETSTLNLKHGVDRIESIGKDAVIVGTNGQDLHFSPIRLGATPRVKESYIRRNAAQGEMRSHGFFYKSDGDDSGWLGLPIRGGGKPGYEHLYDDSASILFLRNDRLNFDEMGELDSNPNKSSDDNCRASCVDWYGNARPLFIRGRVFALLGYEIVEGSVSGNRISETRRINYNPRRSRRDSEE